jgi:cation transport regulator ChaC
MSWLFGYGSLIWKRGFPVDEECPAVVDGLVRRFWQGSTDHRGTPDAPGRVVTLVEEPGGSCEGVALRIPQSYFDRIFRHLDHREQGGYRRVDVTMRLQDGRVLPGVTYYADAQNPHFLGPDEPQAMMQQILASHGPSGPNRDYFFNLADALRGHGIVDKHIQQLEQVAHRLSVDRRERNS